MNGSSDLTLFTRLAQEVEAGRPVVMATVVGRQGSVPREAGAKMLLWASGDTVGSVGGGCAEAEVKTRAREILLRTHASETITVYLSETAAGGTGDVCGGHMDVFLDYISAEVIHGGQ